MNSTDYTSTSASRLLSILRQHATQLPASGSLQEQILLLSFLELESKEQGDLIGHLRMLSAKYGRLLKTFSQDQSLRFRGAPRARRELQAVTLSGQRRSDRATACVAAEAQLRYNAHATPAAAGGRLSPAQREWHEQMRAAGAEVATAVDIDAALVQLAEWRLLKNSGP
jgi:hypothetical protein